MRGSHGGTCGWLAAAGDEMGMTHGVGACGCPAAGTTELMEEMGVVTLGGGGAADEDTHGGTWG